MSQNNGSQTNFEVRPAPTKTEFGVTAVEASDGTKYVVLMVNTITHTGTYFIEPKDARPIADAFIRAADAATGLTVIRDIPE